MARNREEKQWKDMTWYEALSVAGARAFWRGENDQTVILTTMAEAVDKSTIQQDVNTAVIHAVTTALEQNNDTNGQELAESLRENEKPQDREKGTAWEIIKTRAEEFSEKIWHSKAVMKIGEFLAAASAFWNKITTEIRKHCPSLKGMAEGLEKFGNALTVANAKALGESLKKLPGTIATAVGKKIKEFRRRGSGIEQL